MKRIQGLSCGLISVMAFGLVAQAQARISPAQIRQCVPQTIGRQFIDSFSPAASTQYQSDMYVMLSVTSRNGEMSPPSQFPMILKFSSKDQKCSIPFLDPMGDGISYSAEVPRPVAHSLMLQLWKQTQEQLGGKAGYEKYLTRIAYKNNGVLELNRDEHWAFQQLGFKLPSNVRVKVLPR